VEWVSPQDKTEARKGGNSSDRPSACNEFMIIDRILVLGEASAHLSRWRDGLRLPDRRKASGSLGLFTSVFTIES
jgi:hypothetical protein